MESNDTDVSASNVLPFWKDIGKKDCTKLQYHLVRLYPVQRSEKT